MFIKDPNRLEKVFFDEPSGYYIRANGHTTLMIYRVLDLMEAHNSIDIIIMVPKTFCTHHTTNMIYEILHDYEKISMERIDRTQFYCKESNTYIQIVIEINKNYLFHFTNYYLIEVY